MCLNKLKPTTPGSRHTILLKKGTLSKKIRPLKSSLAPCPSHGGRNHHGLLTARTKGMVVKNDTVQFYLIGLQKKDT